MSPAASRRLFVAIFPPDHALDHLGSVADDLAVSRGAGAAGRLNAKAGSSALGRLGPAQRTARETWHVTLAFLGSVAPERVADATSAVTRAAHRWTAQRGATPGGPGLSLRVAGAGTFGTGARQILWAGLAGDLVGLHEIAEAVRGELDAAGLTPDPREFRPHLTITRPGAAIDAAAIATDLARLDAYSGPLWTADAIDLVASDTVPTDAGPRSRYTRLAAANL